MDNKKYIVKNSENLKKIVAGITVLAITAGNFGSAIASPENILYITSNTQIDKVLENSKALTVNNIGEQEETGGKAEESGKLDTRNELEEQNPPDSPENDISVMSLSTGAQFVINGLKYTLNEGGNTVTLSGYDGNKPAGELNVPQTVEKDGITYTVTSLGDVAFNGCDSLTSVIIPDSVVEFGNAVFQQCTGLISVKIPDGVKKFKSCTFNFCRSLTSVTIPSGLTSMGDSTFRGCASLTSVTIPESVTSIGPKSFENCINLKSMVFPSGITTIYYEMFSGCTNLTSVEFPNSVTSVWGSVFSGCSSLKYLLIPGKNISDVESNNQLVGTPIGNGEPGAAVYTTTKFKNSDQWGNLGVPDSVVKIIPGYENSAPNLKATLSGTAINLSWDLVDGVNSYMLKRRGPDESETILSDNLTETQYIDNSLSVVGNYKYSVVSYTNYQNASAQEYDPFGTMQIWNEKSEVNAEFYNILEFAEKGLKYITTGINTVALIGYDGSDPAGILNIPQTVQKLGKTYTVTSIGDGALQRCVRLTNITIPEGVTSIGENAFDSCAILINVGIPSTVTSIGNSAFYNCPFLTSVEIPNNVSSIGNNVFNSCASLASVTIPESITSIGESAFKYCTSLSSITIPSKVTSVGESAFSGCTNLVSVTIPGSVTSIGEFAFDSCTSLTNVTIQEGTTSIGGGAFSGCSSLTSIIIPNSVTTIADWAFDSCTGLISVEIPNSIALIGDEVFNGCTSLKYLLIPGESISSLGNEVLNNTPIKKGELGAALYYKYRSDRQWLIKLSVPDSVVKIIPSHPVAVEDLTAVRNGQTVNLSWGIGNPGNPRSSVIRTNPDGSETVLTEEPQISRYTDNTLPGFGIYKYTVTEYFPYNESPDSADPFGKMCLTSPGSEANVEFNSSEFSLNGLKYIVNEEENTAILAGYYGNEPTEELNVPRAIEIFGTTYSVTSIGYRAFANCGRLTSVAIPDSITSIDGSAFCGCSGLTSLQIPNSVTSIGGSAFIWCSSLKDVAIPNSVTSIGAEAFSGCSSLTNITIPNSVTSIEMSVFKQCSGLTSVIIPNSVTSIKYGVFYGCSKLKSVEIPNSVTSIGNDVFFECRNLKYLMIPGENINSVGSDFLLDSPVTMGIGAVYTTAKFKNSNQWGKLGVPNSIVKIIDYSLNAPQNLKFAINGKNIELCWDKVNGASRYMLIRKAVNGDTIITLSENLTETKYIDDTIPGLDEYIYSLKAYLDYNNSPAEDDPFGETTVDSGTSEISVEFLNLKEVVNNGLKYTVNEGGTTVTLTGYDGVAPTGELNISKAIEIFGTTYTIISIGDNAFENCTNLTGVTIPDSITSIGNNAFNKCRNLTSVTISNSITSIGDIAFEPCIGLTNATIPKSVTHIRLKRA